VNYKKGCTQLAAASDKVYQLLACSPGSISKNSSERINFLVTSKIIQNYRQLIKRWLGFRFMVFNATFNNISVISWQSVLLVEETGVPE
jgi:hypothetical protein